VYNIRHLLTGLYVTSASNGQRVKAESTDVADAIAFTIVLLAPGEFHIQCADNPKVRLYCNNNFVYAGNLTDASAKWYLQMKEKPAEEELLALPQTSTNEQLHIYHLIRTDNGEYAYNSTSPRNKGRIASGIYDSSEDTGYWYYFKQGSQEEKYTIHSYKTKMPVTTDASKLYVNKDTEAAEFTISLDEEGIGFNIATDDGNWYMTGSGTEMVEISSDKSTTWKLQRIRTINLVDDPSTNIADNEMESTPMIHATEGSITVSGLTQGCVVNLYDVVGKLITTATATDYSVTLNTSSFKGKMAIVRVGSHCTKVMIR
jgi:hypothetical protein